MSKNTISGAMLKKARAKEGITQNDLAEKIRIFILI
jgi:transcriptional regulator with XRE-family HTH domain